MTFQRCNLYPDQSGSPSVSGFFIHNPKMNCLYSLDNSSGGFRRALHLILTGDAVKKLSAIHVPTLCLKFKETDEGVVDWFVSKTLKMISKKSLPYSSRLPEFPPIMFSLPNHSKSELFSPDHLVFNVEAPKLEATLFHLVTKVQEIDSAFLSELQKSAGDIPLVKGDYPIFADPCPPQSDRIDEIYQKFVSYNKDRFRCQFEKTPRHCHIRAHFLNDLLDLHGITSYKIYIFFSRQSWSGFHMNPNICNWRFHCAAMVIDSKGKKWIMDPWVNSEYKLQTIRQWTRSKCWPKPEKVMIANRVNIFDTNGMRDESSSFREFSPARFFNSYQYIWGNAAPNPPELPLTYSVIQMNGIRIKRKKPEKTEDIHLEPC